MEPEEQQEQQQQQLDRGRSWLVLFSTFVACAFAVGNCCTLSTLFAPISERIEQHTGAAPATFSLTLLFALNVALLYVTGALAAVVTAAVGYRITIGMGALCAMLGFGLSALATRTWHLLLSMGVLTGFGFGLVYTPAIGVLSYYFSEKYFNLAGSVATSGVSAGIMAFSYVHPMLMQNLGWTRAMLVEMALCAALFTSVFCIKQPDVVEEAPSPTPSAQSPTPSTATTVFAADVPEITFTDYENVDQHQEKRLSIALQELRQSNQERRNEFFNLSTFHYENDADDDDDRDEKVKNVEKNSASRKSSIISKKSATKVVTRSNGATLAPLSTPSMLTRKSIDINREALKALQKRFSHTPKEEKIKLPSLRPQSAADGEITVVNGSATLAAPLFEASLLARKSIDIDRQALQHLQQRLSLTPTAAAAQHLPQKREILQTLLRPELFRNLMFYFCIMESVAVMANDIFLVLTPAYLTDTHGWTSASAALIITVYGATALCTRLCVCVLNARPRWAGCAPKTLQIAVGVVLNASAQVVYFLVPGTTQASTSASQRLIDQPHVWWFVVFAAVCGCGETFFYAYQAPLLHEMLPSDCLTASFGYENLLLGVCTIALCPLAGFFGDVFGTLRYGYAICFGFCCVSVVALFGVVLLYRKRNRFRLAVVTTGQKLK